MRYVPITLLLAACAPAAPRHRFTDVVDARPSPDSGLVAAQVWEDHGFGGPHTSGIVVVARGADPRDGDPVMLEGEDFRPLAYRWISSNALEVRLPCGWWSSLTNHWQRRGTKRVIDIDYVAPTGCILKRSGSSGLPAEASQPPEVWVSPH